MTNSDALFITLFLIVFYSYVGYGILLYLLVKIKFLFKSKKVLINGDALPDVTLLVAAWNEEDFIEEKILNSFSLNYPKEKLKFLFVSDGSNDKTPDIIRKYSNIKLIHCDERKGKTAAVNRAMKRVSTEIVVFSDANALLNRDAIIEIVKHYSDVTVGCVSGEKRVSVPESAQASSAGEGLYWKYESKLKQWDAELYSAAGAAGELFSIRTELYTQTEEDTILDDFIISLRIVEKGFKIAYEPNAYAIENSSDGIKEELKRKIRICAGGFQSIIRLVSLLNVFRFHIFTIQYISHRVLRWTIAPLALFLLLPLNIYSAGNGSFYYSGLLVLQIIFYTMALLGWKYEKLKMRKKIFFVPFYFIMMNYSVFAGFVRFLLGTQNQIWQKAKRAV